MNVGLEIDAKPAAEDDRIGKLSRATRSYHILNIRLEKESAFAQIETIRPLQYRFMALHPHASVSRRNYCDIFTL